MPDCPIFRPIEGFGQSGKGFRANIKRSEWVIFAMDMDIETVNTLPKVLRFQARRYSDSKIFHCHKDFGIWNPYTWKKVYEHTELVHLGLVSMGIQPGDVVGIIGDNDPRWFWAEYAIQVARGVVAGMYVDYHYAEVKYVLGWSKAKFVFAKDQEMVDKILEVKESLPDLQKVIYWEEKGLWFYDYPWLMSYEKLEEMGREYKKSHPDLFEENIDKTQPDDVAVIMLSSGTTRMTEDGVPRSQMGMMSHRSLIMNILQIFELDPWHDTDRWVSYMSPAWGEQYFGICAPLLSGTEICFPEEPETVTNDIREIGPQSLFFTARLWEGMASEIQSRISDANWINRFLFHRLLPIGYKMVDLQMEGKKPPLWLRIAHAIAEWTVFRGLRDNMGLKKIRHAYNAGAILGPDTIRFFHAMGVQVKQLYGTTEVGLHCVHPDGDIDYETVGKVLNREYMKISKEGEILIGGPLLGCTYLNDEESWKKNFDEEGWFHTGDAGHINERGHLVFYDRVKDMVTLPTGRKFSPQYVEARLKFSQFIQDCIVLGGEDRAIVSTLVTIDYENVGNWAEEQHIGYTTYVDLSQKPQVYELIKRDVDRVNQYLSEDMRIKKFVNLHKEFDADDAELTRSGKIRRKFMEERYEDLINSIYSGKDRYEVIAPVKYRDGRTGSIKTHVKVETVG